MSCTVYIVYKSNLSLHHANFGQFKAKQVLLMYFPSFGHPVSEIDTLAAGPAYYVLHPQKVLPFVFFFLTYQAFKSREGIVSPKHLVKDIVVFDTQNKLEKNSLIGVQGNCLYILVSSLVSYFNVIVICFNIW